MQWDMNFCIRWNLRAGDFLEAKKNRGRFNIRLNEDDPAHEAAIRLLEKQSPRSKAQFIVDALLYYAEHHTSAENREPAINRAEIEAIVREVLREQKEDRQPAAHMEEPKQHIAAGQTEVNNEMFSLVADTMAAFRSGSK